MTKFWFLLAFLLLQAAPAPAQTPNVLVNGNASQQIQLQLNVPDCTVPNALTYTAAAGFACGNGLAISGTPAAGQVAMWTGAATLQGVTTLPASVLPSIPASLLPGPTASTLGGVESLSCSASSWMSSLAVTTGVFSCTQPQWGDLGGTFPSGITAPSLTATGSDGTAALTATVPAATTGGAEIIVSSSNSASRPVYAFLGDATTGMGHPAASITNFMTAGAETGRLDAHGHWMLGKASPAPAASSCGTPTITPGSTDNVGEVTVTGAITACTITFGTSFTNRPFCVISLRQNVIAYMMINTLSKTTMTMISSTTSSAGAAIDWICLGT